MTGMLALFFLMYSVNGGATVYYAKDILGDRNLVSTINGIFNVVQILAMFFIAMLVKRLGKKNVFAIGLVLDIIGMLLLNFAGGSMAGIVGKGISEEKLQKIQSTPHYLQSTDERLDLRHGLGLLLVKEIISIHNGTVSISSALNNGFSTTISLPIKNQ